MKPSKPEFKGLKGRVVSCWPRANGNGFSVINRGNYFGQSVTDLRHWYRDNQGVMRPGKGFRLRDEELDEFVKGVRKLKRFLNND